MSQLHLLNDTVNNLSWIKICILFVFLGYFEFIACFLRDTATRREIRAPDGK